MFSILIFGLLFSLVFAESNDKPFLQEITVPKNLAENKTVKIGCHLLQGESVDFSWYLNQKKLEQNARRRVINHDESSELVIKLLSIDDLGEIKCVVNSKNGQDSQKGLIAFNGTLNFNQF